MRIGVVGLGLMGQPIAERLLDAGHELAVFNRTPGRAEALVARGAKEVSSPAELWESAEACITMVFDDAALRAVTTGEGGLLGAPPPGRTLIDMSTISVEGSRGVAEAAGQAVTYLRAPVTGNPSVVRAGNLGIMVSGDEAGFRSVEDVLREIGPNVFYLGPGEEARAMKLALNLMIAGTTQLMAEALLLGEASGLDRGKMLEVMGGSAVGSPFVKYKTAALVADDYTATFSSSAMYKDLVLALEAAHAVGAPLPVTAVVQQLLQATLSSGLGDADLMALLPMLRRQAGLSSGIPGI